MELSELYLDALAVADKRYSTDFYAWLEEMVHTQDETTLAVRRYPRLPLIQDLAHALMTERRLIFPKSRRMMLSWTLSCWGVWNVQYRKQWAGFIQSRTEEAAAFLIDKRCMFVMDHLEEPMLLRPYQTVRTKSGLIGRLNVPKNNSYLWGIAQGAEKIRGYTPSMIFMDEIEFQEEGHMALAAALHLLEHDVQLIMASTSNGPTGPMAQICVDAGFVRF